MAGHGGARTGAHNRSWMPPNQLKTFSDTVICFQAISDRRPARDPLGGARAGAGASSVSAGGSGVPGSRPLVGAVRVADREPEPRTVVGPGPPQGQESRETCQNEFMRHPSVDTETYPLIIVDVVQHEIRLVALRRTAHVSPLRRPVLRSVSGGVPRRRRRLGPRGVRGRGVLAVVLLRVPVDGRVQRGGAVVGGSVVRVGRGARAPSLGPRPSKGWPHGNRCVCEFFYQTRAGWLRRSVTGKHQPGLIISC